MAALQFLALTVQVRILISQQTLDKTAMNTQKGNRGISLSAYAQTLGEMQKSFHTRDVERKMREDHFIAPMWCSPEELKKRKATKH